ncbi:MAG: D-alanine--D-alanine ligase [Candidatus Lambdaproteobacteria bacterium]|nr:D-alanine--D-alanine ligase [Candidatus Lambdaproteobacteria bacterium]
MRVGVTYDLRQDYLAAGYGEEETAEFDSPVTINAIVAALRALGHEPVPIGNVRRLAERLVAGERWELVFNIAEGLRGYAREAQVPALLEGWDIPYTFSDPLTLCLALHKGMAKRVVRDCGIPTPEFAVVETEADLQAFARLSRTPLGFPLFAKPVAEGTGKGIGAASKLHNAEELERVCRSLLARFGQPVLVEAFLPGREFTVGILGTGAGARAIGVLEVLLRPQAESEAYTFHNKEYYENLVDYRLEQGTLADRVAAVALDAWRALGCRDAGRLDLRLDGEGVPNFLEVNPLAGINPERSDLCILARMVGLSYTELIGRILASASERLASRPARATSVA